TGVKRIEAKDSGHKPWPEEVYSHVMEQAPSNIRRMAFLGRATGQRVSDLIKMRPADLLADGIHVRITKLGDKPHFVPLTASQMQEIRSWGVQDLDLFITTPAGKRLSANYLNKLWSQWRDGASVHGMSEASIHGLRATKINDLRSSGVEDGAIADEIGMSVAMVSRYLRFADKAARARASRDRREQRAAGFENSAARLKTSTD
ncbi:MAG: tyrosine-type recombinase/integrase, partial [Xanthobacteraceae bacterium]